MSAIRSIVHFDMDTFFVSVERLLDSRLNGKPVVVGGTGDRGTVVAQSYEARALGITAGLPMKIVRSRYPEVIIVKGDSSRYGKYSKIVTDIIKAKVPVMEKRSVDEIYADMTGMDKIFGIMKYSYELRDYIIKNTGLPLSMGISENKTVSKVATSEAKPNGRCLVEHGREKTFLAPLDVQRLPGVGGKTYYILKELGVEKIGTLQQVPRKRLESLLGENGTGLWMKAQGIDNSPIIPFKDRQTVPIERTLSQDSIDLGYLRGIIMGMAIQIAYELRRGNRMCACISVKVRYADMQPASKQCTIPYTSHEDTIIKKAMELFDVLFSRRQLIRLIGVECSKIVVGGHQMNLLDDTAEKLRLQKAADTMRIKYRNSNIITRAAAMEHTNLGIMGDAWSGEPLVPPANRHA